MASYSDMTKAELVKEIVSRQPTPETYTKAQLIEMLENDDAEAVPAKDLVLDSLVRNYFKTVDNAQFTSDEREVARLEAELRAYVSA